MTYETKPLPFDPSHIKGMSEKILIGSVRDVQQKL
jgi:hypothetical protein